MWGACELNQTAGVEAKWAEDNENPHAIHGTYWASKKKQSGAGIALFVDNNILTDKGNVIYQHPNGKALAVNLSIIAVAFQVIVIHAPSGPDLRSLINLIPAPLPGRQVVLMGYLTSCLAQKWTPSLRHTTINLKHP